MKDYPSQARKPLIALPPQLPPKHSPSRPRSLARFRACREPDPSASLREKIRHIYDICMILRVDEYRKYLLSDEFFEMVEVVANTDRQQFKASCTWLDHPTSEACLFSDSEATWVLISEEFSGNFKDMLYDDDLPADSEVLEVFALIYQQLKASCAMKLAASS